MTRRQILIGSVAMALVPLTFGPWVAPRAEEAELFPDDRVLGPAEAPITIIEYSSLTCPHCAALHAGALPRIKDTWISEGKARLVYRHFPLDGLALRAAAVANCVEGEGHFAFLDLLYESQERWARADDPIKALGRLARLAGMSQARFEACANDEAEMNRILERAQDARRTYDVQATPTLIVNGRKVEGARDFEHFEAIFQKIVPQT